MDEQRVIWRALKCYVYILLAKKNVAWIKTALAYFYFLRNFKWSKFFTLNNYDCHKVRLSKYILCVWVCVCVCAHTHIHTIIYNLGNYDIFIFILVKISKIDIFKAVNTGRNVYFLDIYENLGILFLQLEFSYLFGIIFHKSCNDRYMTYHSIERNSRYPL